VIGIIGTASNAVEEAFPENVPVLISGSAAELAKLGATGTLPGAIKSIFAQTSTNVVVVRVEEGESAEETIENVIGGIETGNYAGVHSFLVAKSKLGVNPRILIAPDFCTSEVVTEMTPFQKRSASRLKPQVEEARLSKKTS
jgi:phage tail sheath protein FI